MCLVEPSVNLKEEIARTLHLSFSQLTTYLICPMRFAHQYVWGTPPESKPAVLVFGKAIHKAVESFYRNLKETGEIIPPEQMVAVFKKVMQDEIAATNVELTFKDGEDIDSLQAQGAELIKLFHSEVEPQKVMAIEFPFMVSIPDLLGDGNLPVKLVGFFDLIEADEDGTYVIGELKTAAQRFSSIRLEHDLQPTCYSYAASKMGLTQTLDTSLVRYDVLIKTKKPAFERYFVVRTKDDHQRLIHLINQVHRAIDHIIYYRNTGWQCGDCSYKKACLSA